MQESSGTYELARPTEELEVGSQENERIKKKLRRIHECSTLSKKGDANISPEEKQTREGCSNSSVLDAQDVKTTSFPRSPMELHREISVVEKAMVTK